MLHLHLRGTPYEQGRQLGAAAAELIRDNVQRASALVPQATGFDLEAYTSMTRRNEAWVARVYPELLEELHGVAETSGVEYSDLLHLNLNTDVAYARAYAMVLDCTQVLATGSATLNGKTYLAKTRDLTRGPIQHVLLEREYDDGTWRHEIQTAGQMTLPLGVNSHGVAVGTSGQWTSRVVVDLARGDSAWHIPNLQPVLRHARSADEAVEIVREQPRVAGMNMLVSDGSRSYALEITADDVQVFQPDDDGILVRTNHYLSPVLQHLAPTRAENPGTFERYARASSLATAGLGHLDMQSMWQILSDHAEPPTESICRHGGGQGVGQTYAAMVICPQDRTVWARFGHPCEGIQGVAEPRN